MRMKIWGYREEREKESEIQSRLESGGEGQNESHTFMSTCILVDSAREVSEDSIPGPLVPPHRFETSVENCHL